MNKQVQNLMFSSNKDNWETPDEFFKTLNERFNFNIDVCATIDNAKCQNFISPEENIFKTLWNGVGFMNPPYSTPEKPCNTNCNKKKCKKRKYCNKIYRPGQIDFIRRVIEVSKITDAKTVCLLPARTDTKIWHNYIWNRETKLYRSEVEEVDFIPGRLTFKGALFPAPFPSMIVVFRGEQK